MDKTTDRLVDDGFRLGVTIKVIDGVLELIGGIALLLVPNHTFHGLISRLALHEVSTDSHAFITNWLNTLDGRLSHGTQLFVAIYLLAHGIIKVLLGTALLRKIYRLYPYAIVFLLIFIFYQSYQIGYGQSVVLAVATVFDAVVAGLAYIEYQRRRRKRDS